VDEQHAETSHAQALLWTATPRIWFPHKGIGPLLEENGSWLGSTCQTVPVARPP